MNITLTGEPKSTNHCWKHSCNRGYLHSYMTPQGKDIKESYQWQAKTQWKEKPTKEPIQVLIRLYFGTKRKQDIDNFNKILLDSLSGIVWEDDSQIEEMVVAKFYDKKAPRIEVEVNRLTNQ